MLDGQSDPLELKNVITDPKYADDVKRLKNELERQKTELKVPPPQVNTKNRLYDEEAQNKRPKMKPLFDRVRKDAETRARHHLFGKDAGKHAPRSEKYPLEIILNAG